MRLTYLLLETLGSLRTADMFDAVVDYPDSAPAIQDLAHCLRHTVCVFVGGAQAAADAATLTAGAKSAGR